MEKFRKKPVIIEAIQWWKNGDHPKDDVYRPYEDDGKIPDSPREGAIVRYYRNPIGDGNEFCQYCNHPMHVHGWIDGARNGGAECTVCPGDYVCTGIKGEYYPCKPDIFKETYEPV